MNAFTERDGMRTCFFPVHWCTVENYPAMVASNGHVSLALPFLPYDVPNGPC